MANQNFKVKTGLEVGTGVTISAGIVTATSFSGNATSATYAVTAGVSTYSGVSGFSTFSGYSNTSGFSTFSGYSNTSGFSTFSGYSNASGVSTFSGYSDTSGVSTFSGYSNLSGISTYASSAGIATTTTNIPNLTGDITSNGTATSIASGVIVNDDINASAAIAVSKLSASTISGVTLGNNLSTLTLNTSGTGLSGSTTYNGSGSATFTVASNATSSNTNSTIVARDGSGNFSAGAITASLSGGSLTNYTETIYAFGNTGATPTFTLSNGNFVTATLNANITSMTFSMTGVPSGAFSFTLFLRNDGTGGRTITWPVSVKWPNGSVPVRTTTANQADVYTFFTTDGGTNWFGNLSLYNYA